MQQLPPHYWITQTTSILSKARVLSVATTNNHKVSTHTIFLQLPFAVHLSLSLDPVAAVCPHGGLGLRNDSSAWERWDSSCVTEGLRCQRITSGDKCQSWLETMRGGPVNLDGWAEVCRGQNGPVSNEGCVVKSGFVFLLSTISRHVRTNLNLSSSSDGGQDN